LERAKKVSFAGKRIDWHVEDPLPRPLAKTKRIDWHVEDPCQDQTQCYTWAGECPCIKAQQKKERRRFEQEGRRAEEEGQYSSRLSVKTYNVCLLFISLQFVKLRSQ
jgi:CelD/BcsL family acetyltransferase involved in cellulose biosynthesis